MPVIQPYGGSYCVLDEFGVVTQVDLLVLGLGRLGVTLVYHPLQEHHQLQTVGYVLCWCVEQGITVSLDDLDGPPLVGARTGTQMLNVHPLSVDLPRR